MLQVVQTFLLRAFISHMPNNTPDREYHLDYQMDLSSLILHVL